MRRQLTPQSSLDNLKREAKRWLKALRERIAEARTRLEGAYPKAPPEPTLRDVQHALALEYGFDGWVALKSAVENKSSGDPLVLLLEAAEKGDVARIGALLDANPNIVSERGTLRGHSGLRTALHFAVAGDREAAVRLLLERGADPNVRDEGDNAMPLHFASEKEQLGIIRLLIEHGADPIGAGDFHELDVIGWATVFGNARSDVVEYLLSHGARHNVSSAVATGAVDAIRDDLDRPMDRTNHRRRPLHLAVVKKRPESLDRLLALGANPNVEDAAGLTPLDQAALNGETQMVASLLEHGARLSLPAAVVLDRDVDRLLAENPGALRPAGRWATLIIRAAEQSPGRVIETLIRHGASVDVIDTEETAVDSTEGYTPLHAAAFAGNTDAARALLAHGASIIARDAKYCGTPAGWANYAHHPQLRDLILEGPIDMFDAITFDRVDRLREIFDRDPAALNRPMGHYLLREPGPNEWTKPWWTPLVFAVVNGKIDAVRALLELGAETHIRHPEKRTLRELAEMQDRQDIVVLLDQYVPERAPSMSDADRAALVARFLANACPDHHVRGRPAHQIARHAAARMLRKHPGIAQDNLYTAVVCGDLAYVDRALAEHPGAAREKGGPKGSAGGKGWRFVLGATEASHPKWEPLLYLCFTRLDNPESNDNAVAIAERLLDAGADPNAYFMAGNSRYSPLTGVIGEGEENRPPHPRRDELTRLLLERGAEPYDIQVFYNIHFHGDVLWYLKIIYEQTVKAGRQSDWDDPNWSMIDMGGFGLGAAYLLTVAIQHDDLALAEWMLWHGASPSPTEPTKKPQDAGRRRKRAFPEASFHELALRRGATELADLLVRFGAKPSGYVPHDEDAFIAAAFRLDRAEAEQLARQHPEYLRSPKAIFAAATRDQPESVRLLLDLGTPIEVEDGSKQRPLHIAAYRNALGVAKLLIERGAEIDPVETNWGNSPMDFARYAEHPQMIDLLAPHSRDLWSLAFAGKVDRLRELLAEDPSRAKWVLSNGVTPLMRLPDDETKAYEIAKMFLDRGADPNRRNDDGHTAIDFAVWRGLDRVAELLRGAR